jgi:hypothetical protein
VHWEMPARVATDLSIWLRQIERALPKRAA